MSQYAVIATICGLLVLCAFVAGLLVGRRNPSVATLTAKIASDAAATAKKL